MGKKDKMLAYIKTNVKEFITTSSYEIIPYNELSTTVFNRAKNYFAKDADYDDVVCLISTSIFETGKSGILFTTDFVYSKAWGGILTGIYKNSIHKSNTAEFDVINEFDTEIMKELMSGLADIANAETKKELSEKKLENAFNIAEKIGAATLGGMAILDIISQLSDNIVAQNNIEIADGISRINNSSDEYNTIIMEIYEEFLPLMGDFVEAYINNEDEEDEETIISSVKILNDILLVLYNQARLYADVSTDDTEEYNKFSEWIVFWALMFYDADQFRESYPLECLKDMPEYWFRIIAIVDCFLENQEWDKSFLDIIFDFSHTVIDNVSEMSELLLNSEWGDEFVESMTELVQSNKNEVVKLIDALDRATDYFMEVIPYGEETQNYTGSLDDSDDKLNEVSMEICEKFIPLISELDDIYSNNTENEIDDEMTTQIIQKLNDILLELYYQASYMADISVNDIDEYTEFSEWINFWTFLFYDTDKFGEIYTLDIVQKMPEYWEEIRVLVDAILEDEECDAPFSNIVFNFLDTVIDNANKVLELLSNSEWDEEFTESVMELGQSNIRAVAEFADELDQITDYLMDI